MAVSDDIYEGVLGVPGGSFVTLLPRASPFRPYWNVITSRYSDPRDRIVLLSYMQLIWDIIDPMGWVDVLKADGRKLTQVRRGGIRRIRREGREGRERNMELQGWGGHATPGRLLDGDPWSESLVPISHLVFFFLFFF